MATSAPEHAAPHAPEAIAPPGEPDLHEPGRAAVEAAEGFRRIVEHAPVAIFVQARERFAYANPACLRLFGAGAPDELLGVPVADRFHPDCRDMVRDRIRTLNGERRAVPLARETILRIDGAAVPVEVSAVPFEHGGDHGALVFVVDLTERLLLRSEVEQVRTRFDALVRSSADHIFMIARDGTVLASNDRVGQWGLASGGQLLGRKCFEFQDAEARAHYERAMAHIEATGEPLSFEHTFRDAAGDTCHHADTIYPLGGGAGEAPAFGCICRDTTPLKTAERKLFVSQKMEAIGQLAGGLAHDFNNLLTIILNYSEMALGKLHSEDPLRRDLEQVHEAGAKAADLTRQLLAFGSRQLLNPELTDLNRIVSGMGNMLGRLIGEQIDLVIAPAPGLPPIVADPGQIEQVIMNLAVNARDAMPEGGKLTFETLSVSLDEQSARRIPDAVPGDYAMLAVSDSGVGMDDATLRRIFEPFFTTKGKGKGTGLGLATVYGIVRQSGGHLSVYSEPGRGTTFKIYFPAAKGEPVPRETLEQGAARRGHETILLVEDDAAIRKLARMILAGAGYQVLEAGCGGEALRIGEDPARPIDLMITDVVMPDMGGRKLADRITTMRPGLPTLYMSGYTENTIVHHGVLEPGIDFISKPFTMRGLTDKIREILDRGNG